MKKWTPVAVPNPTKDCDPLSFLGDAVSNHPDVFCFESRGKLFTFVNHPELVKAAILNKDIVRTELLKSITGDTILTTEGEFWARQRKAALPVFTAKKTEDYFSIFHRQCLAGLEKWTQSSGVLDFERELDQLTLAIVGESLFDQVVDQRFCDEFKVLLTRIGKITNSALFSHKLPIHPSDHKQITDAKNYIDEVAGDIVQRSQGEKCGRLVKALKEKADNHTDEKSLSSYLRDEIITMLIAGHETTSVALSWMLTEIAKRPEVEKNIVHEVDAVLCGRACRAEHVPELKYLSCVLDEILRLYPPIWLVPRTAACDTAIQGINIKQGHSVLVCPYFLHRRSDFWASPGEFDASRFSSNKESLPPYSYLPFYASRHICLGKHFAYAEILSVIATIYQSHRIKLINEEMPAVPIGLGSLRIRGGMRVTILPRHDS